MIGKRDLINALLMAGAASCVCIGMLFISRSSFMLLGMERFWILLGGDFLNGGYIQFALYFASFLNWNLIKNNKKVLLKQEKGMKLVKDSYFPKGIEPVYLDKDINDLKTKMEEDKKLKDSVLSQIIIRACRKFRTSSSIPEMFEIVSHQVETFRDKLVMDTSAIRFLNWCIPSLGFIGTIIGLSGALALAGSADISAITGILGLAFDTTLVALVLNIVLTLKFTELERQTDQILTDFSDFIIDNVINRIETSSKD